MFTTTISSRQFAREFAQAKRATKAGPVFVTDRGKPTLALLSIADYYKLAGEKPRSLLDLMESIPGGDFEFEPLKLADIVLKSVDFE